MDPILDLVEDQDIQVGEKDVLDLILLNGATVSMELRRGVVMQGVCCSPLAATPIRSTLSLDLFRRLGGYSFLAQMILTRRMVYGYG